MGKTVFAAAMVAAVVLFGAAVSGAAAMQFAAPVDLSRIGHAGAFQKVDDPCPCIVPPPARHYWQWGRQPPDPDWEHHWGSPIGHFWGTPQPHLVPANIWARKWHPPGVWYRGHGRWHRRHPR